MEGRARSRISFRRVEGTGPNSQVLRGKFFKTDFTSSSDTAWKFNEYNHAKNWCWTFLFDTSIFSPIFVILDVKIAKKYDGSWSGEAAGEAGVAIFPSSSSDVDLDNQIIWICSEADITCHIRNGKLIYNMIDNDTSLICR